VCQKHQFTTIVALYMCQLHLHIYLTQWTIFIGDKGLFTNINKYDFEILSLTSIKKVALFLACSRDQTTNQLYFSSTWNISEFVFITIHRNPFMKVIQFTYIFIHQMYFSILKIDSYADYWKENLFVRHSALLSTHKVSDRNQSYIIFINSKYKIHLFVSRRLETTTNNCNCKKESENVFLLNIFIVWIGRL